MRSATFSCGSQSVLVPLLDCRRSGLVLKEVLAGTQFLKEGVVGKSWLRGVASCVLRDGRVGGLDLHEKVADLHGLALDHRDAPHPSADRGEDGILHLHALDDRNGRANLDLGVHRNGSSDDAHQSRHDLLGAGVNHRKILGLLLVARFARGVGGAASSHECSPRPHRAARVASSEIWSR